MIQHIWTVPCRVSITNQDTNNVSLIEAMEELTLPSMPAQRPTDPRHLVPAIFDVVTLWGRGERDVPELGYGRSSLLNPQGDVVIEQIVEVDLREARRLRTIGRILGFPLGQAGTFHFRIERRATQEGPWEEIACIPLDVRIEAAPEEQTGNGEPQDRPHAS